MQHRLPLLSGNMIGPMEGKLDKQLLVLYASETGNAIDAAERIGREAERRGCPSVSVISIDEFRPVSFVSLVNCYALY